VSSRDGATASGTWEPSRRIEEGGVPTMVVLVDLNEGVRPEDYERWVLESYAPAVRRLPSVSDWRNHRVTGVLGSEAAPPYRYVVTLEVEDLEGLGRDMSGEKMRGLLGELHDYADVTQFMSERFA
jgi:hypothetical protein